MSLAKKIHKPLDESEKETEGRIDNTISISEFKLNSTSHNPIYKVKNHQELFRIGKSYLKDYQMRITSFAISSAGYKDAQRRTVLGLASYFDQVIADISILIVCDGITDDTYKNMIDISKVQQFDLDEEMALQIYNFNDSIYFTNMDEMVHMRTEDSSRQYTAKLSSVIDEFDIVLWDVPELPRLQNNIECYFPIMNQFHSLSIIIGRELTSNAEIERLKTFFENYNINLKGAIFNDVHEDNEVKEKKWWQKIF